MNFNYQENIKVFDIAAKKIREYVRQINPQIEEYGPISFDTDKVKQMISEDVFSQISNENIQGQDLYVFDQLLSLYSMLYLIDSMPSKMYYVEGNKSTVVASNPNEAMMIAMRADKVLRDFLAYMSSPFPHKINIVTINNVEFMHQLGNAYYIPGQNVVVGYTYNNQGNSTLEKDVLVHEIGHAILDQINPTATRDFHEAFADIITFLYEASNTSQVTDIQDFRKTNKISTIADNTYVSMSWGIQFARDLAGDYKYMPDIIIDPYSLSLPVSSSFYKTWADYVEMLKQRGMNPQEALAIANDKFKSIAIKAAENTRNIPNANVKDYAISILNTIDDPQIRQIFHNHIKQSGVL
ncbi:MAG: hypothetical protein ABDH21_02955 [bacterium]